jgi:hypothetical protein
MDWLSREAWNPGAIRRMWWFIRRWKPGRLDVSGEQFVALVRLAVWYVERGAVVTVVELRRLSPASREAWCEAEKIVRAAQRKDEWMKVRNPEFWVARGDEAFAQRLFLDGWFDRP